MISLSREDLMELSEIMDKFTDLAAEHGVSVKLADIQLPTGISVTVRRDRIDQDLFVEIPTE